MTENLFVELMAKNSDLKGSLIGELLQIMSSGEFVDSNKKPDKTCEEFLCEMNNFEKALETLRNRYNNLEDQILLQFRRAMISKKEIKLNEKRRFEDNLRQVRYYLEIIKYLFFASLNTRFGWLIVQQDILLLIRKDHQIFFTYCL